jgi:predicted O-methyltransferase YrrM
LSTVDSTGAFARLADGLREVQWMTPDLGRKVFDHLLQHQCADVLDIGTCYGCSAGYMAGALQVLGRGRVTTVDTGQFDAESPARDWARQNWERIGVTELIESVRIPHSSYAWWLKEAVEQGAERYDFIYLDGAKNLLLDGPSVVLAERLLRPGGWLLLDDVGWTHADRGRNFALQFDDFIFQASEAELREAHVQAICRLMIEPDPRWAEIRYDGDWAWVRKGTELRSGPIERRVVEQPKAAQRGWLRKRIDRTRS